MLVSFVPSCRPILALLQPCDGNKPVLGKVYACTRKPTGGGGWAVHISGKEDGCSGGLQALCGHDAESPPHRAAFCLDLEYWARVLTKEDSDAELHLHDAAVSCKQTQAHVKT